MKNVIGVAAEYNPFHHGHALHIAGSKAQLADAAVLCVMSGDFVQRGEAAILPKHLRAAAAVQNGADLVLELPLPWSIASAEGFARGMVSILNDTGIVTHMSFGSECGDLEKLTAASEVTQRSDYQTALRRSLESGVSYARARQKALETLGSEALTTPNDLLGIEYLNAIRTLDAELTPMVIQREGAGHDQTGEGQYRSASELRQKLRDGENVSAFVPTSIDPMQMPDPERLETALLSRLQMLPPEAFANTPGAGEGLENLLCRAAHTESDLESLCMAAKSKRYALSRIRRMAVAAALGVTKADAAGLPPYLRVLAANETGRRLLREMKECAAVPIITKPAAAHDLPAPAKHIFELTSAAHDLYMLASQSPEQRSPGSDWRTTPKMV